ncbi:hypothetical protein E2C01_032067 [Portunus trituberculatus]|uniref:Uncharacterized protein n=1 Tax=Portunus trituberculatus TaxID=210409 RepID=A0A5B7EZY4_PORTR|nr:hypothetical protein [Portunus trituberculatus]
MEPEGLWSRCSGVWSSSVLPEGRVQGRAGSVCSHHTEPHTSLNYSIRNNEAAEGGGDVVDGGWTGVTV